MDFSENFLQLHLDFPLQFRFVFRSVIGNNTWMQTRTTRKPDAGD